MGTPRKKEFRPKAVKKRACKEQNVEITVTAEDRASGLQALSLPRRRERAHQSRRGNVFFGPCGEVAMGTMAAAITTYGIAAVQNLNREM